MSQFATWEEAVLSKGKEIAESERSTHRCPANRRRMWPEWSRGENLEDDIREKGVLPVPCKSLRQCWFLFRDETALKDSKTVGTSSDTLCKGLE